jgi:hypothetical protein
MGLSQQQGAIESHFVGEIAWFLSASTVLRCGQVFLFSICLALAVIAVRHSVARVAQFRLSRSSKSRVIRFPTNSLPLPGFQDRMGIQ